MEHFKASASPGAIMEERRASRVTWRKAVVDLALLSAFFAFILGSSVAGLAVIMLTYRTENQLPLSMGLLIAFLAGSGLAGLVGLGLAVLKDWAYDYQPVRTRISTVETVESPETGPELETGPLGRTLPDGRIRRGRVELEASQRLALAVMVVENRETRLSGRKLESWGVIGDRNAIHSASGRTVAATLIEDLIALGYAARDSSGRFVEVTGPGVDYLEGLLPPTGE